MKIKTLRALMILTASATFSALLTAAALGIVFGSTKMPLAWWIIVSIGGIVTIINWFILRKRYKQNVENKTY